MTRLERTITHPLERQLRYRTNGQWTPMTLARRVEEIASESPDRIAVIDGSDLRQLTYGQLVDDARRIAGFLAERGVAPGDGVSVQLPNRYETVVVDLAALMLGARLNPLLPNYRLKELEYVLNASNARVLVVPVSYRGFDHGELANELAQRVGSLHTVLAVGGKIPGNWPTYSEALRAEPLREPPEIDAGEVSEIIFTSGTESLPKAVMHSEETLNHSVRAAAEHIGLNADDIVWMPSPIGHSTGLNFGVRTALYFGLPCLLQDKWDPHDAVRLISTFCPTYTLAAATFLSDLLGAAKPEHDLASLRHFGCGGAPVAKELVDAAALVGVKVERLYGSTEALIVSWSREALDNDLRGTHDGKILADVEVLIWDEGEAEPKPSGQVGEIVLRGPNVCLGFFGDPERTSQSFDEQGWLRTGDLGVIDEQGRLSIVGRRKEIIIRGGLNIAPREIEELVGLHPAVKDCAVVGLPDKRLGETMCVCVVPRDDTVVTFEEIIEFLKDQGLATYKLPQLLVMLPELPRTSTGKLQKFEILKSIESGEG